MPKKTQTFNDGLVYIYSVGNSAGEGDMPQSTLELKETLRFHRRMVGLTRSTLALQTGVAVDGLIRCHFRPSVSPQDVAVIEGEQYRVSKVQRPDDITPPVMDLELARLEHEYEI